MSAAAWHRRRVGKRFDLAVKRALKQFKTNPNYVEHLPEFNVAIISPQFHKELISWEAELESWKKISDEH